MTSENRTNLTLDMSIFNITLAMSEGNPGAISILTKALNIKGNSDWLLSFALILDDMNIRGTQIWLGYKNHCNQDMTLFMKLVKERNQEMIDHINQDVIKWGGTKHKAIPKGASNSNIGRKLLTPEDEPLRKK